MKRLLISLALLSLLIMGADGWPPTTAGAPICSHAEYSTSSTADATLTTPGTDYFLNLSTVTEEFDLLSEWTNPSANTKVRFSRTGETAGHVEVCFQGSFDSSIIALSEMRFTICHDDNSDCSSPKKSRLFWVDDDNLARNTVLQCIRVDDAADDDYFALLAMSLSAGNVITSQNFGITIKEFASCP